MTVASGRVQTIDAPWTLEGRIAIVAPQYPPAVGGVEVHAERIARELARRGQMVDVLATDPTGRLPRTAAVDGVQVRRFRTLPGTGEYFVSPGLAGWLWRHAGRYALLHAHSYHTPIPLIAALAARRHRVPLVITPHFHGGGHTPVARALHPFYRRPGGWALRQAAAIICVSDAESRLLGVQHGISSAVVIPNGIDPVTSPAVDPAHRRTALMAAGRAEAYKHLDVVIDAMALLPANFHLSVVASGTRYEALHARAAASPAHERIEVFSQLSREELDRKYAEAGTFISLSEREAFGMAPLEAASAGCRLVLSDIPAHREISRLVDSDSITFVPSSARADIAAQAIEVSTGRGGPVSIPRLPSWSDVTDATLAVYRRVLG